MSLRFCAPIVLLFVLVTSALAQKPQIVRMLGRDQFPHQLVEGRDGALYGTNFGKVFRLTPAGGFRVLYDFGTFEGPRIVAAEDGHLYGTTWFNGVHILFRLSYDGRFELLHEFVLPAGQFLNGVDLVIGPDGAVYGLTYDYFDGPPPIFFRLSLDGEFSVIADFAGTGFVEARSPIVGHDGAFRAVARRTSNASTIVRIGLDGVVSDVGPSTGFNSDVFRVHAHPDGNYYVPTWSSIYPVSPDGTLLTSLYTSNVNPYFMLLGRDGSFYGGRSNSTGATSFYEIVRINRLFGTVPIATNLRAPLYDPRPMVESHDGYIYGSGQGSGYDSSVFRIRPATFTRVNLPPYARPDFARPPEPGQSRVIKALANDRDVDRDVLAIIEVRPARLGTVALGSDGKSIIYTAPAGDPVAVDEFTYVITDGNGGRGIGRVSLRADLRGKFSGLLDEAAPRHDGHLTVQLGGYGALTGKLWLGGFLSNFAGELDEENRFHARIQTSAATSAEITLQVQASGTSMNLAATIVADGIPIEVVLTKPNLRAASAKSGDYTFVIPAKLQWTSLPPISVPVFSDSIPNPLQKANGDGYGRWRLARSGVAVVTGKMPDGEPFAASNPLDSSGRLPFFATLYPMYNTSPVPMRGWVRGLISFRDTAGVSDADGSLKWLVAVRGVSYYIPPVEQEVVALQASRYTVPASLQGSYPNGLRIEANGGGLQGTVAGTIQATENSLVGSASFRLNGKFNPGGGAMSGHLSRPGSSDWVPWGGVLLQKQGAVRGQFRAFGRPTPGLKPYGTGKLVMEKP